MSTISSSSKAGGNNGTASLTFSSPADGDTLIAVISYSQYSVTRTISTPSGWTKLLDITDTDTTTLAIFTKVWHTGDATTVNWTISGASNDWHSEIGYVINDAKLVESTVPYALSSSKTATPTGANGLVILAGATGGDGSNYGMTATGYTTDQDGNSGVWHICSTAHKNFSTGSVSATTSWSGGLTGTITALVFVDDTFILDAATITSVTAPSGTDVKNINPTESATITSITAPSGLDVLYRDSDTVATVTTPSTDEYFVHPTGEWGPFDTEDGLF